MTKTMTALLGGISILAVAAPSHAAVVTQTGFDPAAVQQVQYYHHWHHRHHWHHWHRGPVVVINPR
jgi:hypothetical protein